MAQSGVGVNPWQRFSYHLAKGPAETSVCHHDPSDLGQRMCWERL